MIRKKYIIEICQLLPFSLIIEERDDIYNLKT